MSDLWPRSRPFIAIDCGDHVVAVARAITLATGQRIASFPTILPNKAKAYEQGFAGKHAVQTLICKATKI